MPLSDRIVRSTLSPEILSTLHEIESLLGVSLKDDSQRNETGLDGEEYVKEPKTHYQPRDEQPKFRIFNHGIVQIMVKDRVIQLEPNSEIIFCRPRLLNQFTKVSDARGAISYLLGERHIATLLKIRGKHQSFRIK